MRLLLLWLLLAGSCTATAQHRPTARALSELQDSVWRRLDAMRTTDPVSAAVYVSAIDESEGIADAVRASGTDETAGIVRVHLIRADSAMKARFRRYVHDSPLIRLEGFDPDTTPCPPAPEGTPPPDGLDMSAEYAFYPANTDCVRLTIRYSGDSTVYFGTDYTVCRFQNGRWETLPAVSAWHSLLIGIGRPEFPVPGGAPQADPYTYGFPARLAPRVYPSVYARYRICKNVYMENPRRDYLLSADFTLTPFVPFTRFSEQEGDNN